MQIVDTIDAVREYVAQARGEGWSVGFVPTMGALHAGHVSLIEAAVEKCQFVVVSVFVNPTQFGPSEDLDKYPRDLDADARICEQAGVDLIFAPSVNEMYRDKNVTWVDVEGLTDNLCGAFRAGHFRGVTTVCTKLFNIVGADIAFFGQKDAQQAIVIRRMVADLNIPLEIEICPTVREEDGLAMSSRNKYLSEAERADAVLISKALAHCRDMVAGGERDCSVLIESMREVMGASADIKPEYISIVDAEDLCSVDTVEGKVLAAIAVKLGKTRLIDNMIVDLNNL